MGDYEVNALCQRRGRTVLIVRRSQFCAKCAEGSELVRLLASSTPYMRHSCLAIVPLSAFLKDSRIEAFGDRPGIALEGESKMGFWRGAQT